MKQKIKKVSKNHQEQIAIKVKEYEKKYPSLSPSEILSMVMEKESQLFSSPITKESKVSYEGTTKTTYFPNLPIRDSKAKVSNNVMTPALESMNEDWMTLATPLYNALVRLHSEHHNVPDSNLDLNILRKLVSNIK